MLTTKKISWKNIVAEMVWFLSGQYSNKILKQHDCKFWDAWTNDKGNIMSGYGPGWRMFPEPLHQGGGMYQIDGNDQIKFVVEELKRNPMSRRLVVSAWNPGDAQTNKLPPCHCMFIFNVQIENGEKILCCHLTQRSADIGLGVPYNIASYALLTALIAKLTGLKPGYFAHTMIDAHVYTTSLEGKFAGDSSYDHIGPLKEQISREPFPLPKLELADTLKGNEWSLANLNILQDMDTDELLETVKLVGYQAHPNVKMKVAV